MLASRNRSGCDAPGLGIFRAWPGFILRRLLWTIPILWVVLTIVFFMMRSIGGDPFRHGPCSGSRTRAG